MSNQFNFVLKKLVLVDSAGFCYSEIELDKHTILLGEGNVGKSSLLNCIRLFLLPEVNFKKAKDKFNFRSSNGEEYGQEQSFEHYFPTKYSHLIIEVEKVIGGKKTTHCQILTRGNNLNFERIFTTLPYQQMRELFWQVEADDTYEIGCRIEKLSTAEIFAKIKSQDKYCTTVKDPQKLKELMYARDILSETAMRYSLFPLNDPSDENIESLRALILMLFDMKTSNKAVAKAVANLIESEKKESTDALNFDIQAFMNNHNQLKLEEQKLIEVENSGFDFDRLTLDYGNYAKLSSAESDFVNFYLSLNSALNALTEKANASSQVISQYQTELKPITTQVNEHSFNKISAEKQIKKLTNDLDKVNKNIHKAQNEINLYGDMPISEIVEIFDEEHAETSEKISALKDHDARSTRITKLQIEITEYSQQQQQLEQAMANAEFGIKNQLPLPTSTLLNSLNPKLIHANPGRSLTENEYQAIEKFQQLFIDQGYCFSLFDVQINKTKAFAERDLQKEIDRLKTEIIAHSSEKKSLENLGTKNTLIVEKDIKNLEQQLAEITRAKQLITGLEKNKNAVEIYQSQIQENQHVIDEASPLIAKLAERKTELSALLETEKLQQNHLTVEQSRLFTLKSQAEGTKQAYPKIQRQLEQQTQVKHSANNTVENLSSEHLQTLQHNLQSVEQLRVKIINGLRAFADRKTIEVDTNLFTDSPLPSVIQGSYAELKRVFDELDNQRIILRNKTRMHNESVSNYVDILNKNAEHITRFESQLNRAFDGISINDLTAIQVSIQIDKRFSHLIKEIQTSFNAHTDEALSEQFYIRLQAFSDAFFKTGDRNKLVMSDIINEVSYKVKKDGHDAWQTKQQSTSTTALINLKLVRMLLAKLRADSCMVQLPVIMDEAANINVDQYEWLLDDIRDSGFFLFTAGTHSSGAELVHMIGHHYDVDALKTAKPYSKERSRVVWGGPQAFLNEENFQQFTHDNNDSQLGLLAGADETV